MNPKPYDLLISGGLLVSSTDQFIGDLGIRDGRIADIAPHLTPSADRIIEAKGFFVLPGYIDAHVHLNEPGRENWEGFSTGTRALLAGGCTAFLDMPLNSTPVLDAASFCAKATALQAHSLLDGGLWGGLVPGKLSHMTELAQCGVMGFKAFMSNSGMADFPRADLSTLDEGMARAAELGRIVAVHAEKEEIVSQLGEKFQKEGRIGIQDYLESRPIAAEVEAIGEALALAQKNGCPLHIVHVSSASGLELIAQSKLKGIDVTAETCPHYLLLNEHDVERLGASAKCAPPLRSALEQEKLWQVLPHLVDTLGSDHSPSPPEMKTSENFFEVWGGIAGAQHNYPLFFQAAVIDRHLPATFVAQLTARNVARRFHLPKKGDLKIGWDADLVLLRSCPERRIHAAELKTRHPFSAYLGQTQKIEVAFTLARGQCRYGANANQTLGLARILRPSSN